MKCPNATPRCTVPHYEDKDYECPHAEPHDRLPGCELGCKINHCGPCTEVSAEG